jgi:hypothetical protein
MYVIYRKIFVFHIVSERVSEPRPLFSVHYYV